MPAGEDQTGVALQACRTPNSAATTRCATESQPTRRTAGTRAVFRGSSRRWPLSSPGCVPIGRSTEPYIYTLLRWDEYPLLPLVACRWQESGSAENNSRPLRRAGYDPPARLNEGGRSCTATTTPEHPFEPASKRRRGFPPVSLALSGAIASSASTPSLSRNSAGTTCARAVRAAAFRRCCRGSGRFDGVQADYYVRDQ